MTQKAITFQAEINGDVVDVRECSTCGEIKLITEFHFKTNGIRRGQWNKCRCTCQRESYKNNAHKVRADVRDYKRKNPDKIKEYRKNYAQQNPEKIRNSTKKRRVTKLGLTHDLGKNGNMTWEEILSNIFEGRCILTGETQDVQMEHFVPLKWRVIGDTVGNVWPLCRKLNESNPFEWIERHRPP